MAFTVQNTRNAPVHAGTLQVALPVAETCHQRVLRVTTSLPATRVTSDHGNHALRMALPVLPPNGTIRVRIAADLAVSSRPLPVAETPGTAWTEPAPLIESDHPEIAALARRLRRPVAAHSARAAFEWVTATLRDAPYAGTDRGALAALRATAGDCTEQALLLVALCRANGVAARRVSGYIVTANAVLRPYDYHDWAEIFDGTAWRVCDPEQHLWMDREGTYLAFRVWGPAPATTDADPGTEPRRFRVNGEGLTVRMDTE
jgi:transglutaminase-like putative cysteine protease